MNAPAQRTDGWRQERAGCLTASTFKDILAVKRDGSPTAERAKLMRVKAFERLSGIPQHELGGKALSWGRDLEEAANAAYMIETGGVIVASPFLVHPVYSFIGASPDGLVGATGGIEMKCPHDEAVHIQTWLEGMPADHTAQVQGNLMVTEREWWDFISYDPRMSAPWRLYVQRIYRDEAYIKTLLIALLQFEAELCEMVETLRRKAA
ncbi:exonuclease [Bordetella trematum]|uniref:Exonuclease n=1 Tax=Bordetella trematum TaxID=123899 RepID=A0A157QAU7_9BORD|nr:lambda exonuclease family protein [Bordetella trematum]AZR93901.1 exonuclease [Bordetella trematum]NNH19030.1 exonuclease [Bordetella trematum]SAI42744.1 exonuclease [Bordetella trematum]SAI72163.1 exonuclease [Bordetella trematum]SUV97955.1 exonuclease [Bordetella trematum]